MTVHGMRYTRLYGVWHSMKSRCLNPNAKGYSNYGGRGISVCDEWMTFKPFAEWSYANGYNESAEKFQCTLDRIDPNLGYSPSNCRWVNSTVQSRNRTNNNYITIGEKSLIASDWSKISGISDATIKKRIQAGWSNRDAVFTPVLESSKYEYDGMKLTLKEWAKTELAKQNRLSYQILLRRINSGQTIEDALTKPVCEHKKYPSKHDFVYHGKHYSLRELSEQFEINYSTLRKRIFEYKWDMEKAIETPIRKCNKSR